MAKNKRTTRTVKWNDPESETDWQSLEEIEKWAENRSPCSTTGRVVFENDEIIVLSHEKNGLGEWGNKTLIWKSLIVK